MEEIQVYLFTGFLDSGKTSFIRDTLADKRFNNTKEPILLLLCEEGEEEYDLNAPHMKNVSVRILEDVSQFNEKNLEKLTAETKAKKVVVEYNGMWSLNDFYSLMPENWVVYQEMMFADANTFVGYNQNMRNLVYDKISSCGLLIFNRCKKDFDKLELHKLVRAISRQTDIAYEYTDKTAEYDDIVDPLPFDTEADVIKIEDKDFALFYRDTTENMAKYDGKTVEYTALVAIGKDFPADTFAGGRKMMTCCADDLIFAGFVCKTNDMQDVKNGDWLHVIGKVEVRFNSLYGRKGPVINVIGMTKVAQPENPIASFN